MKAVIVTDPGAVGNAAWTAAPDPAPARGEIVVDVAAADVNFPDILVMEGKYQVRPTPPFSPGKAGAGVVAAVGEGVSTHAPGDRVVFFAEHGTYAEKVAVPAATAFALPDAIPFDRAAAAALTYQTAWFALTKRARMKAGDRVLVLGASGGVGLAAMQIARALGAGAVIGAARGKEGLALAREGGAHEVVDLGMADLRDGLRDAVRGLTDDYGADIVMDPVGGDVTAAAMRCLAWCGRLVVVGFAAGDIPSVRANYLLLKNVEVSGLQWSDYRDRDPDAVAEAQARIHALWTEGRIDPHLSRIWPMSDFAAAMGALKTGAVKGKIVLVPDGRAAG